MKDSPPTFATPAELRDAIRAGQFRGSTAGQAPGFVQTNLVVVPAEAAEPSEPGELAEPTDQAAASVELARSVLGSRVGEADEHPDLPPADKRAWQLGGPHERGARLYIEPSSPEISVHGRT